MTWTIVALYRFVAIPDLAALRAHLFEFAETRGIFGTLLLASEGINGTVAGPDAAIGELVDELDRTLNVRKGEVKFSTARERPFARLKVRIRPEIITMRAPEADPTRQVGTYVEPKDWNALLADPDVLVIDTRNRYETRVGTFENAVDPEIDSFTEFKDFVKERLDPARQPKVAMFCTGGIRCEKASSFMLAHGFEEVFHLKGGILQYLEDVPAEESRWSGECYVFDGRTAVGHELKQTAEWGRCFGCGSPVTVEEQADSAFEPGVSCPHCIDRLTPERASALRMRQTQMSRAGAQKSVEDPLP
ncbi:oxygen-dependent tRNA uridine(34) hydroxylase TrhO [Aureimonas ureilytica]|uniref:oxygen-dependent tRNA uridine(34) hydroxylase TrhO n=1 Tax=Aureimonas ureilytica TaxID=401562 RepID=UPI00037D0A6A|nr:rhodanese-related sulfurtransferase [Aureimonas ureilytica]